MLFCPVHTSAISHVPFAGRHVTEEFANVSFGQLEPFPKQYSGISHTPVTAWQRVEALANLSAGHVYWPVVPRQYSGTSHGPAAGRHTCVLGKGVPVGHELLTPVQFAFKQGKVEFAQRTFGDVNCVHWLQQGPPLGPLISHNSFLSKNPFPHLTGQIHAGPIWRHQLGTVELRRKIMHVNCVPVAEM